MFLKKYRKIFIHMKSGKTLVIKRCDDVKIQYDSDNITSLTIENQRPHTLFVASIDLKSIEAIETFTIYRLF